MIGKIGNDDEIHWLVSPHTLVNAISQISIEDIASDPDRVTLTRCFKGRRFNQPEFNTLNISPEETLILASDGLW